MPLLLFAIKIYLFISCPDPHFFMQTNPAFLLNVDPDPDPRFKLFKIILRIEIHKVYKFMFNDALSIH